jgi:hypothetical protein
MEDFDGTTECLSLLKPGFGLKDAPRLWNLALQQVLAEGGLHCVNTDRQLFVKHVNGRLVLLLSVHVDDLKMTGEPDQLESLLKLITAHFDELKVERDTFEHLGLRHVLIPDGRRTIDQDQYIGELKHIDESGCRSTLDMPVSLDVKTQFMSLLGGVAWVVQTRPDIAVFVAALQRKLQIPVGRDIVHLNRVLSFIKRKPLKMTYRKVNNPWKMYVIYI